MKRLIEIDGIIGVKFTLTDFYSMRRIKELNGGDINVINGPDEMLICGLSMGADAGIGSTYNLMCAEYVKLRILFLAGDIEGARATQYKVNKVTEILIKYGVIRSVKYILAKLLYDILAKSRLDSVERLVGIKVLICGERLLIKAFLRMLPAHKAHLDRYSQTVLGNRLVRSHSSSLHIIAGNGTDDFKITLRLYLFQFGEFEELILHGLCHGIAQRRIDLEGLVFEIIDGNGLHIRLDGGSCKRINATGMHYERSHSEAHGHHDIC
jgi:hypothetical protein